MLVLNKIRESKGDRFSVYTPDFEGMADFSKEMYVKDNELRAAKQLVIITMEEYDKLSDTFNAFEDGFLVSNE